MFDNANPNLPHNWLYNVWELEQEWQKQHVFNNELPDQGPINIFFSRMSEAMAKSCSGNVYIMTDDPHNLPNGKSSLLISGPIELFLEIPAAYFVSRIFFNFSFELLLIH